jgi:hypothetical protein
MNRLLAVLVLLVSACGDYEAVLHVTFEGEEPPAGGGYRVELRRPSGAAISVVNEAFIEMADGKQDVALVVEKDDIFGDGDSVQVRLYVEAASGEANDATAIGTSIVTVEKGEITDVSVHLRGPPSTTGLVQATLRADGAVEITLDSALSARSGHRFDVWVGSAGDLTRLGELDGGVTTASFDEGRLGEFIVTEEPTASPNDLVRFNGWQVFRGGLPEAAVELLAPLVETGGRLDRLSALVQVGIEHADLAFNATVRGTATLHTEHTFNAVAGQARAAEDVFVAGPTQDGDLNDNGSFDFPSSDHLGLGSEADGDPDGHLGVIEAAVQAINELSDFPNDITANEAMVCIGNLRAAIGGLLTAANDLIEGGAPEDPANSQLLVDAMAAVDGDDFGGGATQTTRCLADRLHTMTVVTLESLNP